MVVDQREFWDGGPRKGRVRRTFRGMGRLLLTTCCGNISVFQQQVRPYWFLLDVRTVSRSIHCYLRPHCWDDLR